MLQITGTYIFKTFSCNYSFFFLVYMHLFLFLFFSYFWFFSCFSSFLFFWFVFLFSPFSLMFILNCYKFDWFFFLFLLSILFCFNCFCLLLKLMPVCREVVDVLLEEPGKLYIQDIRSALLLLRVIFNCIIQGKGFESLSLTRICQSLYLCNLMM